GEASDAYLTMSPGRARTRSAPSSASSSPRSGCAIPAASESGARSGEGSLIAGRSASGPRSRSERRAIALEERHARGDRHFDQLRLRGGERLGEGPGDAVAVARPVGLDAVPLGDRGDIELRQVEPGRAGDLLDFGEPLEDRVLLVAEDQEGDRDVVGDG